MVRPPGGSGGGSLGSRGGGVGYKKGLFLADFLVYGSKFSLFFMILVFFSRFLMRGSSFKTISNARK